jgi:Rhodopirellula transposase DDE domain
VLNVHHYPPGTSSGTGSSLFCHITQTWRGRPLTDRVAVAELIAATTTKAGLKIESALDTRAYEKGIKVSDAQMKALDIQGDPFQPMTSAIEAVKYANDDSSLATMLASLAVYTARRTSEPCTA